MAFVDEREFLFIPTVGNTLHSIPFIKSQRLRKAINGNFQQTMQLKVLTLNFTLSILVNFHIEMHILKLKFSRVSSRIQEAPEICYVDIREYLR